MKGSLTDRAMESPAISHRSRPEFAGRVGLQQRVLPAYRAPFFDLLADACRDGMSVFAGNAREREMIRGASGLEIAEWVRAENLHLLNGTLYLLWQRGMTAWLESSDPDLLILEANPRYLSNRRALRWMHRRNRPVIGWALGAPGVSGLLAPLRRWLRRRYLHRFDALIAYSSQGAREYGALGIPAERIFTAYNAASRAPLMEPERGSFAGRSPRVLFVGRLQNRKRIDMLLQACARMEREVELVIVGEGPARETFENAAAGVFPAARFVGAEYGEQLDAWFRWADLFVLPGTGGLAVQQAMASGLPVIVAEGDGTQADLVSDKNGWLVPPDDLDQLTRALREALSDPRDLIERGHRSYELAKSRFNIEAMTAVFLEAINSVRKS